MWHRHNLRKDNYYFAFGQMIYENNFTNFNFTKNTLITNILSFHKKTTKKFRKSNKIS